MGQLKSAYHDLLGDETESDPLMTAKWLPNLTEGQRSLLRLIFSCDILSAAWDKQIEEINAELDAR